MMEEETDLVQGVISKAGLIAVISSLGVILWKLFAGKNRATR
jgi:hypothetical protein